MSHNVNVTCIQISEYLVARINKPFPFCVSRYLSQDACFTVRISTKLVASDSSTAGWLKYAMRTAKIGVEILTNFWGNRLIPQHCSHWFTQLTSSPVNSSSKYTTLMNV